MPGVTKVTMPNVVPGWREGVRGLPRGAGVGGGLLGGHPMGFLNRHAAWVRERCALGSHRKGMALQRPVHLAHVESREHVVGNECVDRDGVHQLPCVALNDVACVLHGPLEQVVILLDGGGYNGVGIKFANKLKRRDLSVRRGVVAAFAAGFQGVGQSRCQVLQCRVCRGHGGVPASGARAPVCRYYTPWGVGPSVSGAPPPGVGAGALGIAPEAAYRAAHAPFTAQHVPPTLQPRTPPWVSLHPCPISVRTRWVAIPPFLVYVTRNIPGTGVSASPHY